jgi:hypothetical protein
MVDGGKPPVIEFVTPGVGKVLDGGNRKAGCAPFGSTIISVGPPPIIGRSNVRPTVLGGCAIIPPGLIGPTGVAVPGVATGVPDGVVTAGPPGALPASEPDGLTRVELPTPTPLTPLAAPPAPAPTELPAAGPAAVPWAAIPMGSAIVIAKVPKIAFMEIPSCSVSKGQLRRFSEGGQCLVRYASANRGATNRGAGVRFSANRTHSTSRIFERHRLLRPSYTTGHSL